MGVPPCQCQRQREGRAHTHLNKLNRLLSMMRKAVLRNRGNTKNQWGTMAWLRAMMIKALLIDTALGYVRRQRRNERVGTV